MTYAIGFAYVPSTSDGLTVLAPEPQRGNKVACFCDCGCGNFAADDFCTSCYDICLGEPCDCSLKADSGFYKIHAQGAEGCECNADGTLRDQGDEFPDGYGGFGAPHCACGELSINCDGLCQYGEETAPEVEPSFEDYLARRMEPRELDCDNCGEMVTLVHHPRDLVIVLCSKCNHGTPIC